MSKRKKQENRFIIGLGGGHREYSINNTRYVVEGRFAKPSLTDADRTMADAVEDIVTGEFTDLTPEGTGGRMRSKPVRSADERER